MLEGRHQYSNTLCPIIAKADARLAMIVDTPTPPLAMRLRITRGEGGEMGSPSMRSTRLRTSCGVQIFLLSDNDDCKEE